MTSAGQAVILGLAEEVKENVLRALLPQGMKGGKQRRAKKRGGKKRPRRPSEKTGPGEPGGGE